MKTRKLLTGKRVKSLDKPHKWKFESKCPAKWVHVDCESGHIYIANIRGGWLMPTRIQIDAAIKALKIEKKFLLRKEKP
jgi:hypothetical protein